MEEIFLVGKGPKRGANDEASNLGGPVTAWFNLRGLAACLFNYASFEDPLTQIGLLLYNLNIFRISHEWWTGPGYIIDFS